MIGVIGVIRVIGVIGVIMIMIMIRYWKDSTQCWLHPGGGGTLKTKRGLITTNLVQKYNY